VTPAQGHRTVIVVFRAADVMIPPGIVVSSTRIVVLSTGIVVFRAAGGTIHSKGDVTGYDVVPMHCIVLLLH